MAQRKSEGRSTPRQFLDEVRYASLDWPGKTVRLDRRSVDDYCERPASGRASVAELYHENSKLFREMLPQLAATRVDADALKIEFVRRRSAALKAACGSAGGLPAVYRGLLSSMSTSIDPGLHYSMELRVLADGVLAVHEPVLDLLYPIKGVAPAELGTLGEALGLVDVQTVPSQGELTLFVVGNFARNDLLYGPRGYRRTLLDAGRVSERLLQEAARLGLEAKHRFEFMDREIDTLLEADGIEEGVVAAIELGRRADAR